MIKPQLDETRWKHPFDARLDAVGLEGVGRAHWNLPLPNSFCKPCSAEKVSDLFGALAIATGKFTGRSPKDRFLVKDAPPPKVDWGDINQALSPDHFQTCCGRSSHLNGRSVCQGRGCRGRRAVPHSGAWSPKRRGLRCLWTTCSSAFLKRRSGWRTQSGMSSARQVSKRTLRVTDAAMGT